MPRYVEYCQRNVPDGVRSELERSNATIRKKRCLQRCGTCYSSSFLVVDGRIRVGSDHDELVAVLEREYDGEGERKGDGEDEREQRR